MQAFTCEYLLKKVATSTAILVGLCALSGLAFAASPPNIATMSLPAGTVGQTYSAQLNATDGISPYTWSLLPSNSLPPGLSLSSSGLISGTPTTTAISSFTVQVADSMSQTEQKVFSISSTSPSAACAPTGGGTCYYVSPTGSDSNNGSSNSPFATIQKAASVVSPGDMVIVRDGTYSNSAAIGENAALVQMTRGGTSSNWITFVADHKWGAVLDGLVDLSNSNCSGIDPTNCGTGEGWTFYVTNTNCSNPSTDACYIRLQGFEIKRFRGDAFSNYGGGQYLDLAQNHIHDMGRYCANTNTGRDGIYLSSPNVTVEQNLIHDIGRLAPGENGCSPNINYQNHDHGIYVGARSNPTSVASNVTIENNILYNIERGWGVQVYNGDGQVPDHLSVLNNTFAFANPWRQGQIIFGVQTTNALIENNVFYKPLTAAVYFDPPFTNSSITLANNVVTETFVAMSYDGSTVLHDPTSAAGATYSNNKEATDPKLFCPSAYDFRLVSGSPAIDAGLTLSGVTNDFSGITRPQGAGYDMGAYEFDCCF